MQFLLCTLLLSSLFSSGNREVSFREYEEKTRKRVSEKIYEALGDSRATVSGIVTYAANDTFFLQSDGVGLKAHASGKLPSVGDVVRVGGSPSLEGGNVVLLAEEWSQTGKAEIPTARAVTADELVGSERKGAVNGLRVSVRGRVIGATESGFAMKVDGIPINVMVSPLPEFLSDCGRTHPIVAVTGIAEQLLDQLILLSRGKYVMGVKINVQSAADVILRPDFVYLAARRNRMFVLALVVLLGILGAGVVVFLVVIYRQRRGMFRTRTIMAERKRMADDIHDTIEQHLVGAGMLLRMNRLAEAQDVLVRAKREIRDIVWGLKNDDLMRLSPADMLRNLSHEENTKGICRVDTHLAGLPATLEAAAMRDLCLIVRETISNAVKHGGARKIAISSDPTEGGGWLMRISNDGEPFDPDAAPGVDEGHFGLEGMRQRARRLGADIRFERRRRGMVLILEKKL